MTENIITEENTLLQNKTDHSIEYYMAEYYRMSE